MAQGMPAGPFLVLLAAIHGLIGLAWFAMLIAATRPLARALYASADIGDTVPSELYQAVAEVLAYVYRLKHRRRA